jgi:cytochrome bd-type quinol oxidase subunit 2
MTATTITANRTEIETDTGTETKTETRGAARTNRTNRHLVRYGAVAGVVASAATVGVAATAHAAGVPIEVGGESIPLAGFAQVTIFATAIGVVLASVFARRARNPRRAFVSTTLTLTALTFLPDVLADAQTSTKLTLMLTHVVAAAIVIPTLASRLAD